MPIQLRGYQQEFVDAVEKAVGRGVRRQLGVLPTGGGKTIVFSEIVRRRADKPTLILAHRDELLQQAREKLISVAPELSMSTGLVKAGSNEVGAPVVIASIQTLARESRLNQLPRHFGTVIVDEGHHAVADSYQRVLDYLDAELVLFVTATPKRADGKSLEHIADEVVFARSLQYMIEQGYLCPPRGKRITVDVDLDSVKKSRGDFQADALAEALEDADVLTDVLATYMEHGEDRKTLIFTPTVAMAHHTAEVFCEAGYAAEAVDGTTPPEERRDILERLHTGDTRIVANVGVLTEGFDEPSIECIILAAPTKSEVKYTQIIGRGLRLYPGKSDCLILDVAGASEDKSIQSLGALFGLGQLLDDENVLDAIARERREAEAAREQEQADRDEERDRKAERRRRNAESIEFFSRDRMNWRQIGDRWTIPLDANRTIVLWPRGDDRFDALMITVEADPEARRYRPKRETFRFLGRGLDLGYAQGAAEETIRAYGSRLLADRKAAWREDPVSPAQRKALSRIKLPIPKTKGEAADLLDEAILSDRLGRIKAKLLEMEAAEQPEAVAA